MKVKEKIRVSTPRGIQPVKITQQKPSKQLVQFLNHSFVQMLDLLELELCEAFEEISFCYKGSFLQNEVNADSPEALMHLLSTHMRGIQTHKVQIQFSIYCNVNYTDDVQFWGYSLPLLFVHENEHWMLHFHNASIVIREVLPMRSKRLLLRHLYFNILDDYNNHY